MRLILIHQAFSPPQQPGGTRHYELLRPLVHSGHLVTVVASDLVYGTGQRAVHERRLVSRHNLGGITVLRAYTYPSLHRSFAWRIVAFMSFMLTSTYAALRAGPVDLVMGTSPPIFQAASTWLVAWLRHRPFLLEIRDLWPEFAIDMGVLTSPILIALSRWLERFLYRRATHIVVNSPAYEGYLHGKGVPRDKITLIANGVDPTMFDPTACGQSMRERWGLKDEFVVAYTGALGLANDIPTILRAAQRLHHRPDIHFLLVGDGKEKQNLEALAAKMGLQNVIFAGSVIKGQMSQVLAAADACVATLQDIPMFRTTYPNKVFDYMAAGRPTILAIDGVIRKVIEAAQGGIFVPPGDDQALAGAVLGLAEDRARARALGKSARMYVVEHFDRHQQAEQFAMLLQRVTRGKEPASANRLYRDMTKRIVDLVLAGSALILLSPVLALLALLIRARLGSPVLFRQERAGLGGKPFIIYKFRTMTDERDSHGCLLPDASRLTPLGRFLRKTSLDELPELYNVLRGEMSLVGPRPLLMEYLERYTEEQSLRHQVIPGITGWSQINGRQGIPFSKRLELDSWYVQNQSLALDLKILLLTIPRVLQAHGVILGQDVKDVDDLNLSSGSFTTRVIDEREK